MQGMGHSGSSSSVTGGITGLPFSIFMRWRACSASSGHSRLSGLRRAPLQQGRTLLADQTAAGIHQAGQGGQAQPQHRDEQRAATLSMEALCAPRRDIPPMRLQSRHVPTTVSLRSCTAVFSVRCGPVKAACGACPARSIHTVRII